MNINWVEIPVKDMERAMNFYSEVFQTKLNIDFAGPPKMSFLPFNKDEPGSSCTLIEMPEFYEPSKNYGPLVYFTCNEMEAVEERITKYGGKVLISRRQISPEHGYMAVFIDSEGNRIALHSQH